MKILLTGSGGFIGGRLKEYLKDKFELLVPRSFELDLTEESAVEKYFRENSIDLVVNCATNGGARGVEDAPETLNNNLKMIDNILKFKGNGVRVILFGSGAMYDKSRTLHRVKESELGKFVPGDLYGRSKMLIAQKIQGRKDVVCLNIFACYGPGEKESRFPTYAINCVLNNQPIIINQNVIFDYLFVEDMQKIVEHFIIDCPVSTNIINITPDSSISLLEISNLINEIGNTKVDIIVKNPVMNLEYTGSNDILRQNIPDFEFKDIKEGLKILYNYKKENLNEK